MEVLMNFGMNAAVRLVICAFTFVVIKFAIERVPTLSDRRVLGVSVPTLIAAVVAFVVAAYAVVEVHAW